MRESARDSSLKNVKASPERVKPNIRAARKDELDALLGLEEICFKEETFHKNQLKYLLFNAKSIVLLAALDGEVVGSMIILLRKRVYHARIYSLNVHPQRRRAGIGGLLMDTALKLLKEKGFRNVSLEVGVNNKAAQKLYKSKGFLADKTLYRYYKNGDDALHLARKL